MKGDSEARVGAAIRAITGAYAYKPPDDARNRKPCDFFVWRRAIERPNDVWDLPLECTWVEVKDQMGTSLPASGIRSSQRAGVAEAMRLGIPYWLVVRWRSVTIAQSRGTGPLWTAHLLSDPMRGELWKEAVRPRDCDFAGTLSTVIACVLGVRDAGVEVPDGESGQEVREGEG